MTDTAPAAQATADWTTPTGLGTSAARIAARFAQVLTAAAPAATDAAAADTAAAIAASADAPVHDPAYALRPWGDGSASPLYVPVVERTDDALVEVVEDLLVGWARDCGFRGGELDQLRGAGFGRLAVLTHTDTDDPEHLLIAAKLNAAWWAADDLYADDSGMGATPTALPPKLALAMAAMDPVPDVGEFTAPLEEALRSDPVLVALRSGVEHLTRYGTPAQVQRACYSTFAMFVSWNTYGAWRYTGEYPPAWEYLAARQHDSFYTSMTLVDAVGGYEVPANLYYEPRVRRAAIQAGTASVVVNDLLSVAKDAADETPVCNMVLQIAADRQCSVREATEVTVELHNRLVRDFEAGHRELSALPSPELHRFLRGLRAWMGGGFEWHNTNPRYRT
ncbi:2-methylisoborneol synthase [Saccharothrix tamanrassetensis]|uniref:2-methylisoborneol synthase n=1 Tax=Saccharothrix tamanrassetensis TaxID=1051531 RepID=A0A841CIG5_9PSEU|nr:family 2 encapsulin nanocompartment cargo protein terpene cyclase [Saccharothrix tamanrassetensis]MBB5957089.1 2-methylisoborneol synthase [Saccharothrix tamanrassetensis]